MTCTTCWFASGGDAVHCGKCACCVCLVCGSNVSLCNNCLEDDEEDDW
jgi:hypothetical protein